MIARPPPPLLLCSGLLALALSIGGCADATRNIHTTAIAPSQLGLTEDAAPIDWPAPQWWQLFADNQLDALIAQALTGSPSLNIAAARVRQAQEAALATRATREPEVGLNGKVDRQRYSENYIFPPPLGGSTVTDARLALDFSYEFDFWGKQRATVNAALKQLEVQQTELAASQLMLSIAVAQSYFSLQHSVEELALAQALVQQREATLKLQKLRAERGLISRGDIQTPTAQAADAHRVLAASEQRIAVLKHQLAALTGQGADALRDFKPTPPANDFAMSPPQQLPADLLARRADIIAQRLRIEAASQDVEAARADFYPNIDLNAYLGLQSLGTENLLQSSSKIYGAGPAVHLPIFNRDKLRAQLGARFADYDIAVAQYNDSVLAAVREAADASSNLRALSQQRSAAEASLQALQQARTIAELRYRRGFGNYLDVLSADGALLAQQRSVAAIHDDQRQATLALIKALGGGYPTTAPLARPNEVPND